MQVGVESERAAENPDANSTARDDAERFARTARQTHSDADTERSEFADGGHNRTQSVSTSICSRSISTTAPFVARVCSSTENGIRTDARCNAASR